MRWEKVGQVLHEHCARKLKEFLLIFSFVTEQIRFQLDKPVILSIESSIRNPMVKENLLI
jgi:hypothetical protein